MPVGTSKRESKLLIENDEIVIQGPNVSIGYVANPSLNAEKFIIIDGQRAFKTGDKGYLDNGMLFFKGREDDLIKLHGFRIELNEINAVVNDFDFIEHAEAIALRRNGSVKKIVMLFKFSKGKSKEIADIESEMAKKLPHYMIPSDFKIIDEI